MWSTLLITACLYAPPLETVEDLPNLLGEEFDLIQALDSLDDDRRLQEKLLAENQTKRVEVIARRDRAAARYSEARKKLQRERNRIRRRIQVYVDLKKVRQWQLLASAGDYATYLRMRRALGQLVQGDESRIRAYHDIVKAYHTAKTGHEEELAELDRVENRISDARTKLERDKAIKTALLESVRADKKFWQKADRDLDRASLRLQKRIDNFKQWKDKRLWFRDLKGQYLNPVPGGEVKQGYGKTTHPKFQTNTFHRGLRIVPGRKRIRKVRVIYWGRVVYAGWLRGYGNTIIVDHTKGDYTLYAHLADVKVKEGDVLKSRQEIGIMGRSGALDGEMGLYFELRLSGKPVNPISWFR